MIHGRLQWCGLAWVLVMWGFAVGGAMAASNGPLPTDVPAEAQPVDVWKNRILMTTPDGLWQLDVGSEPWQVLHTWRTGQELPAQFFGLARYLPDGSIVAATGPQLVCLKEGGVPIPWLALPAGRHVHHLWVGESNQLWIVYQPTPTVPDVLLQRWRLDGSLPDVVQELRWSSAATVADGCVDGAGDLWLATTGGLMQVTRDGDISRQGPRVSYAVACGPEGVLDVPTGGELVELDRARRDTNKKESLPHLGRPIQAQHLYAGDDAEVFGAVLFSSGRLAWWRRDGAGNLLAGGLWGAAEGVPESVSKMLWEPSTERLLVASHDHPLQALPPFEILGASK